MCVSGCVYKHMCRWVCVHTHDDVQMGGEVGGVEAGVRAAGVRAGVVRARLHHAQRPAAHQVEPGVQVTGTHTQTHTHIHTNTSYNNIIAFRFVSLINTPLNRLPFNNF